MWGRDKVRNTHWEQYFRSGRVYVCTYYRYGLDYAANQQGQEQGATSAAIIIVQTHSYTHGGRFCGIQHTHCDSDDTHMYNTTKRNNGVTIELTAHQDRGLRRISVAPRSRTRCSTVEDGITAGVGVSYE